MDLERKNLKKSEPRKASDSWKLKPNETKAYFFDIKGDQNNIIYGSLYRLDVPIYYRKRFCLGKLRNFHGIFLSITVVIQNDLTQIFGERFWSGVIRGLVIDLIGLDSKKGVGHDKQNGYYFYKIGTQDNSQKIRYSQRKYAYQESDVEMKR